MLKMALLTVQMDRKTEVTVDNPMPITRVKERVRARTWVTAKYHPGGRERGRIPMGKLTP